MKRFIIGTTFKRIKDRRKYHVIARIKDRGEYVIVYKFYGIYKQWWHYKVEEEWKLNYEIKWDVMEKFNKECVRNKEKK